MKKRLTNEEVLVLAEERLDYLERWQLEEMLANEMYQEGGG